MIRYFFTLKFVNVRSVVIEKHMVAFKVDDLKLNIAENV